MHYLNNWGCPVISGYQGFLDFQVALGPEEVISVAYSECQPFACLLSNPLLALYLLYSVSQGADSYRLSFLNASISWLPTQFWSWESVVKLEGEGKVSFPFLLPGMVVLAIVMFFSIAPAPLNTPSFLVVITYIIVFEIPRALSDFLDPCWYNDKEPVVGIVPGRLGGLEILWQAASKSLMNLRQSVWCLHFAM